MKNLILILALLPTMAYAQLQPAPCTFTVVNPVLDTWTDFYDPGGPGGSFCNDSINGNYPNSNCITSYRFVAPAGEQVRMLFDTMAIYNTVEGWDWMVIYDGGNANSPILFDNRAGGPDNDGLPNNPYTGPDNLCVPNTLLDFCSTGRKLFIRFSATSVVSRAGWHAKFRTCSSALPVELTYFDGDCNHLYWTTASEHNSDYFIIESTLDGVNWTQVSEKIPAAGNSQEENTYTTQIHSRNHLQYYRLVQVDFDGTRNEYNVISIRCEQHYVNSPLEGVYDMMGKRVGDNINSVAQGHYILRFEDQTTKRVYVNQ